ncbi:hypothetical protein RHSIM_Rhsim06G0139800 [Rhododendron simsii]|uniref:Uncharacterized protein n=1 Tax=Rhododendron simsii TaxID=118357 RepID=A0A834H4R6_RHOSS|nr:hypothetical protein RHSIM_Rhsim06G0139800 [Rhododendron simsii]
MKPSLGGFRRHWGFCVGEKLMSCGVWGSKGGKGGGGGATMVVVKEAENTSMNPPLLATVRCLNANMLNLLTGSKTNRSDANEWDVYKSTHFNNDAQKWISEESGSEKNYGKIIEVEADVTPMTQEEFSIKSLKAKSRYVKGYVKGLGMRPSSSLRTTVASAANSQYVSHLESLVQEYQEEMQAQQQKIDVLSESTSR